MSSLNLLPLEDLTCNFELLCESYWKCLKPPNFLGIEGFLLWQKCRNGNSMSCQWNSFDVDIACLRNVLFMGKTLSPSANWESIHGCSKRWPVGEIFLCSVAPPQTGGMWAALWWGLWRLCHFHTSGYRMTPILSDQRVHSLFNLLGLKAFKHIRGRLLLSLVGKLL